MLTPFPASTCAAGVIASGRVGMPGYTAELSALTRGQMLELHLGRVKGTPPKKPAAGEKDKSGVKDKTAAKDKDKPIDRDLVVTMVVIMTEAPARPNGK